MFLILILLICLFVEYEIVAIHSDRSKRLTMLNDNGRSKQRIINANDLSNVFSNKVTPTKRNEIQFSYSDNDEANLYNDEEDDDESTVKDSNSNKQIPDDSSDTIKSSFNNKNNERTSADTDSKYNNLNDMNDKDIFAAPPKMSDFNVESELGDEYDSFMNLDGDLGKVSELQCEMITTNMYTYRSVFMSFDAFINTQKHN